MIHQYILAFLLAVESLFLLEINNYQTYCRRNCQIYQSCNLAYKHHANATAKKRDTDTGGCQHKEPSSESHEFKWFLETLENREMIIGGIH